MPQWGKYVLDAEKWLAEQPGAKSRIWAAVNGHANQYRSAILRVVRDGSSVDAAIAWVTSPPPQPAASITTPMERWLTTGSCLPAIKGRAGQSSGPADTSRAPSNVAHVRAAVRHASC